MLMAPQRWHPPCSVTPQLPAVPVAPSQKHGFPHPMDSIAELTARIRAFRDARDWMQFHSPKDLSVAIIAEAGELLQHFVWKSPEESWQRAEAKKDEVASEIADVAILLFELADNLGLDLASVMHEKITRNDSRYPADKARGSNLKYNEL